MEVREASTNGENYQLHVFTSKENEVLDPDKLEKISAKLGIAVKVDITGWKGIHLVITTSNNPSLEMIHTLCGKIKRARRFLLPA